MIKTIICICIIVFSIVSLMWVNRETGLQYFTTIQELQTQRYTKSTPLRVSGSVGEIVTSNTNPLSHAFLLTGEGTNSGVHVLYTGILPDNFVIGSPVIVEGKLQENNVFMASRIMTPCPSKYQNQSTK